MAADVPSLCGVLLTVCAAGVTATIRLAVRGDGQDGTPVRSSLRLPLSANALDGVIVLQASVPQAFDELAHVAVSLLLDGGLGVVVDRHLSRTTAAQSQGDAPAPEISDPEAELDRALSDASVVNQAIGALLGQGFLPVDAATELDRRAGEAGLSRVAAAAEVLEALTGAGRVDNASERDAAPPGSDPDPA